MLELVIKIQKEIENEKFQVGTRSSRKRSKLDHLERFPKPLHTSVYLCLYLAHLPISSLYCLSFSPVAPSSFTGCSLALINQ